MTKAPIIVHMGEEWRVIGVGVEHGDSTFCHLSSLTKGRQQKNGWCPVQIGDWVKTEVLKSAKE